MRHKRDFYTDLLPFDEPLIEPISDLKTNANDLSCLTTKESLLKILTTRLTNYLAIEAKAPKNLPILKLLPSLNKVAHQERAIKFTEDQAIELLKELGVIIEPSPTYLGRSRYRITISQDLINRLLENNKPEK